MRKNVKVVADPIYTAEGAKAVRITSELQLRRSVLACLLWEDAFYVEGKTVADHISDLCEKVSPSTLAALAIEARHQQHLRHVPLLLLKSLVKTGKGLPLVAETIEKVISRADELAEFVAIYWDGKNKKMLPAQMKKGLARAFHKFNAYALAKYNRDAKVKLRDVLFLCHAKPKDDEQAALWKSLVDGSIKPADTWEVRLSGGAGKKATFEEMIRDKSLGYFALLRNLRGMTEAGVDQSLIKEAILARGHGADKVLPFRYIAAAKVAPQFERELDKALIASFAQMPKLPGKTILVVDVSGSMNGSLSRKSDMTRVDTAAALAAIVSGCAEEPVIYATAGSDARRIHSTSRLPARQGMAMIEAIHRAMHTLGMGGIFLTQCLSFIKEKEKTADRIIVITDEQDCDTDPLKAPEKADAFGKTNYLINISVEKNGIGYKPKFVHIDGWSENVIRYIIEAETSLQGQAA